MAVKAFDVNFCFPIRDLENERVKLTPFIVCPLYTSLCIHYHLLKSQPAIHNDLWHSLTSNNPELYKHLPYGPFSDAKSFLEKFFYARIANDDKIVLFVVFDKTRGDPDQEPEKSMAGMMGYLNTSPTNLATEIGGSRDSFQCLGNLTGYLKVS